MPRDRPIRLSPKVRGLVASDRQTRPAVGRLTRAQIETLAAIARGASGFDEPVSAYRAIAALAAGAPAAVAAPILDDVAGDVAADPTSRVAAARGLGVIATSEAQEMLLGRARDRDPRVQQAALASLGYFAAPSALRVLDTLREPGDLAARRQLALTRALIAHRHGLDGPFLPAVEPVARRSRRQGGGMATLSLRNRGVKATAADRALLRGPTYGIDLAAESFDLRCGRSQWTIFVNRELGPSATRLDRFFERPWIAALLARWAYERLSLATQYVVLVRAVAGAARIEVVRADGEVVYAGSAENAGAGFAFAVADIARPGTAPTKVEGRLRAKGIDVETATPAASRTGTRHTEAIEPSAGRTTAAPARR